MAWSSFPPAHKRSLGIAVTGFAAAAALLAGWVWLHADAMRDDLEKRTPRAVAAIKTVYVDNLRGDPSLKGVTAAAQMPPPAPGEGYVSIIMTDLGMSAAATTRALGEMPPEITLAYSPYSPDLAAQLKKAQDAKHETLILLPMEPATYPKDDPGPRALLIRQSDDENSRKLADVLRLGNGTVGAMNYMGAALLGNSRNMNAVLSGVGRKSALFVENPQGGASTAAAEATTTNAPYIAADLKLDANASELEIQQQLLKLENLAKQRGYAVAVAQPYPITFNMLANWTSSLAQRGVKLAPLTAVFREKSRQDSAAQPPPMPAPDKDAPKTDKPPEEQMAPPPQEPPTP